MPASAELLVLFAAAAEMEDDGTDTVGGKIERKDNAREAAQRQQAENRRRAHFKSNNRVNT